MTGQRYHHGNLRPTLLSETRHLLAAEGVEGLSLRRLAQQVGVSRSALYHHFRDKHDLLCAVASEGFLELEKLVDGACLAPGPELEAGLRRFVRAYLAFATDDPERYELMFGRTLWKQGQPNEALRTVAYRSFRRYVARIEELLQRAGVSAERPLRVAQASWATLHGVCRLLLDGIYLDRADMEEVSEEAIRVILIALQR
ncbi:TetR family transcriptional regulator [Alkalilimnicola ehrlichii]|uniref:TetR family transcriptional regulator n=1 Tax=Alkalilimnicola ehrlichii TaxID=351052 RepID=A0A3E0X171_9GAMM|nr:TetR/AcrR family transcriptional regulator [Alkalilimnicola ehrlichii]RFA30593.1 TetR family transcriptional regulator [Alkalilimnicola ehrlichii]RFA38143.1 TetR family transcriptional regulator [Alkalilimnicola ehrlichii]